jgi:nucleotide-binding universal stress UspA family protein
MDDTILVPTDGSKPARDAAMNAIRIAEEHDSTIHALYVMDMGEVGYVASPSDIQETRKRREGKGLAFTRDVNALAADADIECVTEVRW